MLNKCRQKREHEKRTKNDTLEVHVAANHNITRIDEDECENMHLYNSAIEFPQDLKQAPSNKQISSDIESMFKEPSVDGPITRGELSFRKPHNTPGIDINTNMDDNERSIQRNDVQDTCKSGATGLFRR